MTDELPMHYPDAAPPTANGGATRRCRHPKPYDVSWTTDGSGNLAAVSRCFRCHAVIDPIRARRGKSARRLGNDQERRAERAYGWRKVGEFGGITDLEDEMFVVQQKATRAAPPIRWTGIFDRLAERAGGRTPLLLLSFVRQGVPTEDFVVVRGSDWRALHGPEGDR